MGNVLVMQTTALRYDIYSGIHKGLRAFFASVLLDLGKVDWDRDDESEAALASVATLVAVCEGHIEHENRFIHTAMEARRPGSTQHTAGDHEGHGATLAELKGLVATLRHLPALRRSGPGRALYRTMATFFAENLEHMAFEESENNRVLWETHDDAEIHAIEQGIVASLPPEEMMLTLRWMLPALGPTERAAFLAGMRREAPPPAFAAVLGMIRPLLAERDQARLDQDLAA